LPSSIEDLAVANVILHGDAYLSLGTSHYNGKQYQGISFKKYLEIQNVIK